MKAILALPTTGPEWDAISGRTVAGYMTNRIPVVDEHESILYGWELLNRTGHRHLPVVAADGRCRGVIGIATLATAYAEAATGRRPAHQPIGELLQEEEITRSIRWTDPLAIAVRIMAHAGTDVVAVLDDRHAFVGLVTAADVVAALAGRRHEPARLAGTEPAQP